MQFLDERQLELLAKADPELEQQFKEIMNTQSTNNINGDVFRPSANVLLEPRELVIIVELPGICKEDIQLGMSAHELVIQGVRKEPLDLRKEHFLNMELSFGPFMRRFQIPAGVNVEEIDANYADGFLIIKMLRVASDPVSLKMEG
jgi:HSP20 family protein